MDCKYDFICEYELKAHSPLIHFQAEQCGANLRATEVKPKLDKFLIKKADEQGFDINKYKKSHNALNYKLTVEDSILTKNQIISNVSKKTGGLYFAKNKAFQVNTKIRIVCFDKNLRNLIDKHIEEFFIVHNFGTRQNKGFGSYTVTKKNSEKCEDKSCEEIATVLAKHYGSQNCYCFSVASLSEAYEKIIELNGEIKAIIPYGYYQKNIMPPFFKFYNKKTGAEITKIKDLRLDRCPTLYFFKIIDNTVYFVAKKIKRVDYKSKKYIVADSKNKANTKNYYINRNWDRVDDLDRAISNGINIEYYSITVVEVLNDIQENKG